MSFSGCRSSGNLTADALGHTGRCKLVSIHAINLHATDMTVIVVYDNTAGSGKVVAKLALPGMTDAAGNVVGGHSMEYDMHGVKMLNGIYIELNTAGTPHVAVTFA